MQFISELLNDLADFAQGLLQSLENVSGSSSIAQTLQEVLAKIS